MYSVSNLSAEKLTLGHLKQQIKMAKPSGLPWGRFELVVAAQTDVERRTMDGEVPSCVFQSGGCSCAANERLDWHHGRQRLKTGWRSGTASPETASSWSQRQPTKMFGDVAKKNQRPALSGYCGAWSLGNFRPTAATSRWWHVDDLRLAATRWSPLVCRLRHHLSIAHGLTTFLMISTPLHAAVAKFTPV